MRRQARRDEEEDTKIKLTPMLDVVFIMLIFFVVTSTFAKEVGLEVNQPEDAAALPDSSERKLIVRITSAPQPSLSAPPVARPRSSTLEQQPLSLALPRGGCSREVATGY